MAGWFGVLVAEFSSDGVRLFSVLCVYGATLEELSTFLGGLEQTMGPLPTGSPVVGDMNIDIDPTHYGNSKYSIFEHLSINSIAKKVRTCTIEENIADHQPCVGSVQIHTKNSRPKFFVPNKLDYARLRDFVYKTDGMDLLVEIDASRSSKKYFCILSTVSLKNNTITVKNQST